MKDSEICLNADSESFFFRMLRKTQVHNYQEVNIPLV